LGNEFNDTILLNDRLRNFSYLSDYKLVILDKMFLLKFNVSNLPK